MPIRCQSGDNYEPVSMCFSIVKLSHFKNVTTLLLNMLWASCKMNVKDNGRRVNIMYHVKFIIRNCKKGLTLLLILALLLSTLGAALPKITVAAETPTPTDGADSAITNLHSEVHTSPNSQPMAISWTVSGGNIAGTAYSSLTTAIAAINFDAGTFYTITGTGGSVSHSTALQVNVGKTISIDGDGATITQTTGRHFNVNGRLTLGNIILDGGNVAGGVKVEADGFFAMTSGAVIQNSLSDTFGGGVYNSGTFTMNEGTISGNSAQDGGGVYNEGTFDLQAGEISGNIATIDGGGIFNTPMEVGGYADLTVSATVLFSGNTSRQAIMPPTNPLTVYPNIQSASTSIYTHPLNNYDISRTMTPVTVYYIDRSNGAIGTPSSATHFAGYGNAFILTPTDIPAPSGYVFADWKIGLSGALQGNTTIWVDNVPPTMNEIYLVYDRNVTSVSLNKTTLALTVGGTETLIATISPVSATNQAVTWSSDNTNAATVDMNGSVKAVAAGTANITVTTQDGGYTAECAVTVRDITTVINTPANLNVTKASTNSIKVSWAAANNVDGYEIWFATSKNGTYKKITSTSGTSYTHSGLTIGKTYYYKARSYKTVNGATSYSGYTDVKLLTLPIPKPTGVKTANVGATSIKIFWTRVSGASGYEVYRATSKNGKYTKVALVGSSKTSYTNKNLKNGTTYYYKVRGYKTIGGTKKYSSYSSMVKRKAALAKPTITLKAGKNSITVSWKKVTGASKYEIYRATTGNGVYKKIATVSNKKLSNTNKKLTTGKKYYYKVKAVQQSGKKTYRSVFSNRSSAKAK